jgi:electron transfer flavoprotein beta subunit
MDLNIIVCIKSVVLDAPEGRVVRLPETCALNPFDLPALEMALRLREEKGGRITALSMGPDVAGLSLYEAIAMGIDRAILISDPALAGSDTLATSTVLGAAVMKLRPFDLILFGTRTSDSDTGHVGTQTAVRIGLPIITGVYHLECTDAKVVADRRADEFNERYEVSLPAAITVYPTALQARDSSLSGIEKAFVGGVFEKMNLSDLGLSEDQVGEKGSATRIISMDKVRMKRKCEFITGSIEEQADELVRRLRQGGYIG